MHPLDRRLITLMRQMYPRRTAKIAQSAWATERQLAIDKRSSFNVARLHARTLLLAMCQERVLNFEGVSNVSS